MALRIGFKIHRYLGQNKLKCLLQEPTRTHSSKPRYVIHPVRRLRSSTTNVLQRKYASTKPLAVSYRDRDMKTTEYDLDTDLQPSAMPNYYTSTLESHMANFPEKSDLVGGRFAMSNTQNAITVPLKLPRLANPFPERLKSFPSDTMADDEKAQLMHEEIKMTARYNLQKYQESRYQQQPAEPVPTADPHSFAEDYYWQAAAENGQPQSAAADTSLVDEVFAQDRRQRVRDSPATKPRTRSARYLNTSRHIKPSTQRRNYSSGSAALNPVPLTDVEQCDAILDHLKAQYPEYRTLKRPLFVSGSREERDFIQSTLKFIAKHRIGVDREPAPFPSYSEVKTFVRAPTLPDIKLPFKRDALIARKYSTKCVNSRGCVLPETGQHMPEASQRENPSKVNFVATEDSSSLIVEALPNLCGRSDGNPRTGITSAPLENAQQACATLETGANTCLVRQPGLHSSRTDERVSGNKETPSSLTSDEQHCDFDGAERPDVHCQRAMTTGRMTPRPRTDVEDLVASYKHPATWRNSSRRELSAATETSAASSRSFSTRPKSCKPDKKSKKPTCPTMKSPGCTEPYAPKCEYVYTKSTCKKKTAPYPSYSECMGDQYEEEPSECKICPWKVKAAHSSKDSAAHEKKKYSTLAPADVQLAAKKSSKKSPTKSSKTTPCPNPYDDKKPCDFERTAEKHDTLRHRRPATPGTPKPSATTDKKSFSTLTSARLDLRKSFSTLSNRRLDAKATLADGKSSAGSKLSRFSTLTNRTSGPKASTINGKSSLGPKPGSVSTAANWDAMQNDSFTTLSTTENPRIVDRIRDWLNSWRAGSDRIRITKAADLPDGRETYIIEIQDLVETRQSEIAPWISADSLRTSRSVELAESGLRAADIAGFACADSGKKSGKVGGCPPSKKKKPKDEGDDKPKCRQRKKRKLPSCHDVGKEKPKKNAQTYSTIDINVGAVKDQGRADKLAQKTQEIAALQEPRMPSHLENIPFKLKPQFWRM